MKLCFKKLLAGFKQFVIQLCKKTISVGDIQK